MKKFLKIFTVLLVFCCALIEQVKAQGVDAIFFMDNSSSIDVTEWDNMSTSTKSLIDEVLGCNPNNRVAVVHFSALYSDPPVSVNPRIFLESNFTNNSTAAKGFLRRGGLTAQGATHPSLMGQKTFAYENTILLDNALGTATASSQIISSTKKLSRNTNNKLVIFMFTDSPRTDTSDGTGGGLVRLFGSGGPYDIYNQFKSNYGATFVVLQAPTGISTAADTEARAAAAAIASVGGSYNGTVEANASDPEGSGVKPRKAVMSSTFSISSIDIETLADNICSSCAPTVEIDAVTPPTQNVCLGGTPSALVAAATGTGTLSYQWYSNSSDNNTGGTLIPGATSANYTPPAVVPGTVYYYVVVSDTFCDGTTPSPTVSVTTSNVICSSSCALVETNLQPFSGQSTQGAFSNNDIYVGTSKATVSHNALAPSYFSVNTISDTHFSGDFGLHLGHTKNDASGLLYSERIESTISFDAPVSLLSFRLRDLDLGDNVIVNAYDENDNLINLGASNANIHYPANVSRDGNRFYPPNPSFEADNNTLLGSVDINYYGQLVSRVTFIFYDTAYTGSYSISNIVAEMCPTDVCTQLADDYTTAGQPTKVGITVQKKQPGWPENIPNGFITLESKEKGFVITRVSHVGGTSGSPTSTDSIEEPREGMMVYDIQDSCVKLYNGEKWKCIEKSCNK